MYSAGISLKTQELRLLVFCTRYLDLFTTYFSLYNTIAKIYYITATAGIVIAIKYMEPIKSIYNFDQDSFQHWKFCVVPSFALAWLTSSKYDSWMQIFWLFSIYLESVAILPQLIVLRKYRLVENLTGKFLFLMGWYRFWYIVNWWYRSTESRFFFSRSENKLKLAAGVVQVILFCDFFWQYCRVVCRCRQQRVVDEDDDEGLIFELSGDPRAQKTTPTEIDQPLLASSDSGALRKRWQEDDLSASA